MKTRQSEKVPRGRSRAILKNSTQAYTKSRFTDNLQLIQRTRRETVLYSAFKSPKSGSPRFPPLGLANP